MRSLTALVALAAISSALGGDGDGGGGAGGASSGGKSGLTKAQGPPPFFLQDPADSLCLAGESFKRCSVDTLFFVVGSPGHYQIHKRPADDDDDDDDEDGTCVSLKSCSDVGRDTVQDTRLTKCTHCGARDWNINGDAERGYILTEGPEERKLCLVRRRGTDSAAMAPCDSDDVPYTPLQLQFASASDIKQMGAPAARLIGAASDGDTKTLTELLRDKKADVNARDWDQLTAIIPAASTGNLDMVRILIREGADVNAKDKDGITALMEASIMGHKDVVDALLEAGAEVDQAANSEVTAMWLAAGEGRADVVRALLSRGADAANARTDGITALMSASVGGHSEVVRLLLENGADLRATDGEGLTALHNAAENGTVAVLKALVDFVAEEKDEEGKDKYVDTMSTQGFTPIIIAAAHGHADAARFLIESGADASKVNENGVNSLMYAAAAGHVDAMTVLLDAGTGTVDVDGMHSNGGTAMIEAATGNSSRSIEFLIERGAKVDRTDSDGVTPLMAVASQGNLDGQTFIIDALKKFMDDDQLRDHINLASFSGGTSVMFSAAGGHPECTKALIELGANVNEVAQATPEYLEKLAKMIEDGTYQEEEPHVDGLTAVHVAAQGGHLEDVKLLIEAGADVTKHDDEDRTPLLLAVKGNFGEVASELVRAGADPNTPYVDDDGESHNLLMDAVIVENVDFAELLIDNGADLYHVDDHGVTTLLQASHRGLTGVVERLLSRYASDENPKEGWIDGPSDEGITPLIAASSEGHGDVVKLLLATGKADVDAKDKDGTNSLMAASARGHVDIVGLLLGGGASVNHQNVDGHTALMFAYNGKNQVETLWERYHQFVAEAKVEKKGEGAAGGEEEEEADDGGTGPLIREALDNHTRMVEMLIKGGADEKIKDKEGHTAKDFDYHPDADAEVLDQEKRAEKKRDESRNEL